MIPLNLSPSTQSALADISALASSTKRIMDLPVGSDEPLDMVDIGEKFCEILDRFDITPQEWGTTCDKLHRTGSNA